MFQLQRLFSGKGSSSSSQDHPNNDVVCAQNGKDLHEILFEKGSIRSGDVTVGTLRAAVSKAAGVPADSVTLVCGGKKLKEDNLAAFSYGVKPGSKILCMASKNKLAAPTTAQRAASGGSRGTSPAPAKKILTPMQKIDLTKDFTRDTLMPLVVAFETSPPADKERKEDEHRRLGETVMGELIKLDAVDVDGENGVQVRKKRKEMIRQLQAILERLDTAARAS